MAATKQITAGSIALFEDVAGSLRSAAAAHVAAIAHVAVAVVAHVVAAAAARLISAFMG